MLFKNVTTWKTWINIVSTYPTLFFFLHLQLYTTISTFSLYVTAGLDHRSAGDSIFRGHEDGVRGGQGSHPEGASQTGESVVIQVRCVRKPHKRQWQTEWLISRLCTVRALSRTDVFGPRKPDYKQALWRCHGDRLLLLSDGTYWPIVHLVYGTEPLVLPPECRNLPSAPCALLAPGSALWLPPAVSISCPPSYPHDRWIDQLMRAERGEHDGCYWCIRVQRCKQLYEVSYCWSGLQNGETKTSNTKKISLTCDLCHVYVCTDFRIFVTVLNVESRSLRESMCERLALGVGCVARDSFAEKAIPRWEQEMQRKGCGPLLPALHRPDAWLPTKEHAIFTQACTCENRGGTI